jgi:hypothetical protein
MSYAIAAVVAVTVGTLIGQLIASAILAWRANRKWQKLEQEARIEAMRMHDQLSAINSKWTEANQQNRRAN